MIKTKTVFVVGAGAHCPYGFPDGETLTRSIVAALPATLDARKNRFYDEFFGVYGPSIGSIHRLLFEFRNRLNNGGHSSIDSFLATHANATGYAEIGKFAVASTLLPLEFQYDFGRNPTIRRSAPDGDWLSYLFRFMQQGCLGSAEELIGLNRVSFVTFNYDRTLEHFLCRRLQHTYGIPSVAAWEQVKKIPIVHVYGSLGEFNPDARAPSKLYPENIRTAGANIRLMYEDRHTHPEIDAAQKLIADAQYVCFLGFGFDPDNIERLKLNELCKGKFVLATRYKVAEGDWRRSVERMHPTDMRLDVEREWDALTFLHETRALG